MHPTLKADFILANPPFNYHPWNQEKLKDDPRWKYGLPPANNANFAWIQHMIYHLAPNGKIGLVLANGALSTQSGGEGDIRKKIIEADLVEGIIALPTQLFYIVVAFSALDFSAYDDYMKAKDFTPSAEMKGLIDGINLTDRARNILYASSPQLKDKTAFNGVCGHDGDPDAFIAGCYYQKNGNEYIDIYNAGADASSLQVALYDYNDSKMVTLTHEMLHAVHARLNSADLEWINRELDMIYSSNTELRDELKNYPESEKYDELYTRSATEVYALPNKLEKHYGQFFNDRQSIVKKYKDNKKQIEEMLAKADEIMVRIKGQESKINSTSTVWEYKSAVEEYNKLVEVYNNYIGVFRDTMNKRDSEK